VVFYRSVPSQLTLHFEQLVFKDEPVVPVFVDKPAGYRIASQQLSVTQVRIRGSEDRVRGINQVKTDPLELGGVAGQKVFRTHLNIGDPQVRLVDGPADITVQVKLEKIAGGGAR
jgi:YbbR domain-containing protein